ncbi:iron-containing redox enzyme family protein [Kineosporia sp. J2-2]|uniref:Iron-containing redox enzyme family protein n=1 Tax=Kineosporia corallincola TaxID=2835133 RepID=A0ABS5TP95_9ACTN|nr:iron-containing redox enzyme family protein [Kineosporia corallincola]MBT0772921.1 iron-containing redox enzyme family protein [Kineosporia corallincola]
MTAANDANAAHAAMHAYADRTIFRDSDTWEMSRRPFHRSLRPQALHEVDLARPLTPDTFMNYESLAAQRVLTCVYEQDLVFLPEQPYDGWLKDFEEFYSPETRELAGQFRGQLEQYCFGYLEQEIEVSPGWTREDFTTYLDDKCRPSDAVPAWEKAIRESPDPKRAARMWLVQFAPDFLSESSPMMKNVLGNYGPVQSEWFKILIDEYGYGVHPKKHSTLFENTLRSVGLNTETHYYWQYYLASALAANNYFHYLGSEHRHFFRYVGALIYTETTLVEFCRRAAAVLNDVFEGECDVEYFTEHLHIDDHHGRMALNDVAVPLIEKFGPEIIPDLVRGIQGYDYVMNNFDSQFSIQISWMDEQEQLFGLHKDIIEKVQAAENVPLANLDEHFNELSNSHCHNQDELCHIISGQMYFFSGLDSKLILNPGDGVVIRNRRQHGADILSDGCKYQIYTIGDVNQWV